MVDFAQPPWGAYVVRFKATGETVAVQPDDLDVMDYEDQTGTGYITQLASGSWSARVRLCWVALRRRGIAVPADFREFVTQTDTRIDDEAVAEADVEGKASELDPLTGESSS